MASFKVAAVAVRRPRPNAAHDYLSLPSCQSPVLPGVGDGRLT